MHRRESTLAPATGPYCELHELLGLRAAAARLCLSPPARALSQLSGPLRSNLRGRGIEFEEVRSYEPGDDVRNIDWRVTARTGKAHTKTFREERERPVFVLVDQRQGMFFGSRRTLKSVQAVHAAALLAWATLAAGDRIGGLVLGEHEHHEVKPRRNRGAALELLRTCHAFNRRLGLPGVVDAPSPGLGAALTAVRRVARPGSLVVLISDFAGLDAGARQQLHLLARHTDIAAIQVFDPLEQALPGAGRASVSDGKRRVALDAGDERLRERYRAMFRSESESLASSLARIGAPLIPLATDLNALDVLARVFRGRKR